MSQNEDDVKGAVETDMAPSPPPVSIFISYRREDAAGYARALYQELKGRFGAANVFIDAEIPAGARWLREINERNASCAVFLALIGPSWLRILGERSKDRAADYVRVEIEGALKRDSGAHVIPVVVDGAPMPTRETLPWPSLRGLAERQALPLRHPSWDDDIERLVGQIQALPEARVAPAPLGGAAVAETREHEPPVEPALVPPPGASSPDDQHYESVARYLVDPNRVSPVVVFLGSGVNACDSGDEPWLDAGSGWLPNADELAQHLARQFGFASGPVDLAQVAQYVYLTEGGSPLYKTVRRILAADCPPTSVHRFLARLPAKIETLGYPERYQLIVTSNYDDALERAFDEAEEPYDLAVYMASGERRGKFLHIPHDGEPELVADPVGYRRFPIEAGGDIQLRRTVIVKIHGAIDSEQHSWRENYVMTEDQYIDYLVKADVPSEIAAQIKGSHCLFVGYTMRDWNLRVFLHRMWGGQRLEATSWAIERHPDEMERRFLASLGIDLFAAPLDEYVRKLESRLASYQKAAAQT